MNNTQTLRTPASQLLGLVALMRPKQWVKNAFVLAPLVFARQFMDPLAIQQACLALILFCVAASATYVINDLQDIERDRRHPKKSKTRPLASGAVSPASALSLVALLYAMLIWGWFVAPAVVQVIGAYMMLNLAYTFFLKHQPVLDIFVIAIGFVLRVYAGALALSVPVSGWMFITTLCLALYLASVKRRQELRQNGTECRKVLEKYSVSLVDKYMQVSAIGALIFYSLFVMSSPYQRLVATVPLVLFGLFRYWYMVEQLDGGESPTDALYSDWQLLGTVVAWVSACIWALWIG